MTNRNISESMAVLATVLPSAQVVGSVNSPPFQLNKSRKAMATIFVGASAGTVNAKIQSSATSGGSYVDVAGAAIAPISGPGQAQIELRGDRVNALGAGPFYQLVVIVAGATTPTAAVVQGSDARYEPNSDNNDATVLAVAVVI
jgi:hypothetical protein